jgi:hypothetical protein
MAMPYAHTLGGVLRRMKPKVSGTKKPDARPSANCRANSVCKFGEKGSITETMAIAVAALISTCLGPYTPPNQIANGATSI